MIHIEQIRQLIGGGKLEQALNIMGKWNMKNQSDSDLIILFKARYAIIKMERLKGIITENEKTAKINNLQNDVLTFLATLSNKVGSSPIPSNNPIPNKFCKAWKEELVSLKNKQQNTPHYMARNLIQTQIDKLEAKIAAECCK